MDAWIFFSIVALIFVGLLYALKSEKGWPGNKRFHDLISPPAGDSAASFYKLMVMAMLVVIVVFGVAVFNRADTQDLGTFGDFIGGVVNPILTFFTFFGLLVTIVLQQKAAASANLAAQKSAQALDDQLRSQERQSFESTFFQMLTLHNTIVNSIDLFYTRPSEHNDFLPGKRIETKGRDCFKQFYQNYKDGYSASSAPTEREKLQEGYDTFWERRQQDLAHYYRYLYNVLRFVHEFEGDIERVRYVRLLRAQLSDYELALLFYTALNKNGIKYWVYIHEYQLFDNLPYDILIRKSHSDLYSDRSFGEPKTPPPTGWPPRQLADELGTARRPE